MKRLLCLGFGYCARALAAKLSVKGWSVAGTARTSAGIEEIQALGYDGHLFDGSTPLPAEAWDGATHILHSIPPQGGGDPVLLNCREALEARARDIAWFGYLSTTGVYGDRGGDWVEETSPLMPTTERGQYRRRVEDAFRTLSGVTYLPVHVFRLAGIYGPGRNQLESVLDGAAKRVIKPGQIFSRIHVDDVAGVLEASIDRPRPGAVYNVADNEPAPPQEVVEFAARLLGRPVPPAVPFEEAELSPMAKSFYAESKRVSNRLLTDELGYALRYPTYREGLSALLPGLAGRR